MIPFSILSGKMNMKDGSVLEIRALDLFMDGFSFRLPKEYLKTHGGAESFELSFFIWEEQRYRTLETKNFEITTSGVEEFFDVYRLTLSDKEFGLLSAKLSREYLHYIECKLELSDEELAVEYTEYPADREEEYGLQISESSVCHNGWEDIINNYSWGICVENRVSLDMYLNNSLSDFVKQIFEKSGLTSHPLRKINPRYIYLGNSYCPRLLPPIEALAKAFEKSKTEACEIIIVLPPASESDYDYICNYVNQIIDIGIASFQVNDLGMKNSLQKIAGINVTEGVLLTKARRDPRAKYLENKQNFLMRTDNEVYLPFYQTNTGTFCPLYAAVKNGGRGNQIRVTKCDRICEKVGFIYLTHLEMTGRYNSLFGFNSEILNNPRIIAEVIRKTERPVINL